MIVAMQCLHQNWSEFPAKLWNPNRQRRRIHNKKTLGVNPFREFSKPISFEKLRNDLISNPRVVCGSVAGSVLPRAAKITHFRKMKNGEIVPNVYAPGRGKRKRRKLYQLPSNVEADASEEIESSESCDNNKQTSSTTQQSENEQQCAPTPGNAGTRQPTPLSSSPPKSSTQPRFGRRYWQSVVDEAQRNVHQQRVKRKKKKSHFFDDFVC